MITCSVAIAACTWNIKSLMLLDKFQKEDIHMHPHINDNCLDTMPYALCHAW